jgi:hypothetical protein
MADCSGERSDTGLMMKEWRLHKLDLESFYAGANWFLASVGVELAGSWSSSYTVKDLRAGIVCTNLHSWSLSTGLGFGRCYSCTAG